MGFDRDNCVTKVNQNLICPICLGVLEDPRMSNICGHVFCNICISVWLFNNSTCPMDRKTMTLQNKCEPPQLLNITLSELLMKCRFASFGCYDILQLSELANHQQICRFNPKTVVVCRDGCGTHMRRQDIPNHKCVQRLMNLIKSQEKMLTTLKNEIRCQYRQIDDLRKVIQSLQIGTVMDEGICTWSNALPLAKILDWNNLLAFPSEARLRNIQYNMSNINCPVKITRFLLNNSNANRWPVGINSEYRLVDNRDVINNYICRRIPGSQAVIMLYNENKHQPKVFKMYPGILFIFTKGVMNL